MIGRVPHQKIMECVPNVSEGRDSSKIAIMKNAIQHIAGVQLLHTDPNPDANRTVFTFAGMPNVVEDAAFSLVKAATQCIDMRRHKGTHVRNGAVDVCPFVPVSNVTMEECRQTAHSLARRVANNLALPSYLYGEAAIRPERKSLSYIRKGQYEALEKKLSNPARWAPDFGPGEWSTHIATAGTTQIGARPFLLAFNVNLATRETGIARKLARIVRSSGHPGIPEAGMFPALLADGWYMNGYECAQVTMNFTDYRRTPLHLVYEKLRELAQEHGTEVTGSELIGLIPLDAIVTSGRYYLRTSKCSDTEAITAATSNMGMNDVSQFCASERIVEFLLAK